MHRQKLHSKQRTDQEDGKNKRKKTSGEEKWGKKLKAIQTKRQQKEKEQEKGKDDDTEIGTEPEETEGKTDKDKHKQINNYGEKLTWEQS